MHRIHVEELVSHRVSERLIGSEGRSMAESDYGLRLVRDRWKERGPRVPLVSR